jgi:hypothetical protein
MRKNFRFTLMAEVVIEDGKITKILLDGNDWADNAMDDYPDLTNEEARFLEHEVEVPKMVEVGFL